MIGSLLGTNANFIDMLISILMRIPAVLIAISVHEAAHGYVAYKLGDPTAKLMGRVTVNPLAHFDLFGVLCMLVFGFGWAKPVPFDLRVLKHPKRDTALIAAAGPVSNLFVAFIFAGLWALVSFIGVVYVSHINEAIQRLLFILAQMLLQVVALNIGLMFFNLLPIPPLDGSKVLFSLLPASAHRFILTYERYGMGILMLMLLLGDRLPWFLNLGYWVSFVASYMYDWIMQFWMLIANWMLRFIV